MQTFDRYSHHYLGIDDNLRPFMPAWSQRSRGSVHAGLLGLPDEKPIVLAKQSLVAKGVDGFFQIVFGDGAFERKKPVRSLC